MVGNAVPVNLAAEVVSQTLAIAKRERYTA
jgi:hypothetical protein